MDRGEQRARRACMFVYNTMVHDARVRKEARTLTESGWEVTVLAINDPGRTPREETVHGFRIVRLSRSILGISRREMRERVRGRATAAPSSAASGVRGARRRRSAKARAAALAESVVRLSVYPLRRLLVYLRFVRAALRTKAEVYHAHDLNTLLMAWTASRLRGAPLVYDTHEVATDRTGLKFRWWAALLEGTLIRRADRVICTTQTRADFTQRKYGIAPPVVLRNLPAYVEPTCSGIAQERMGLSADTKLVLYQGGMQVQRGLEELLEAATRIEGGVVLMLGSGRLKPALMERAERLGLEGKVYFHDAVPVDELPEWTACGYVGMQLLQDTCFNHHSSLSNKLLEYLMSGVPVVASDLPEMRRVIEDTGAGVLIDASKPEAIAEAVNRMLREDGVREEMARRAREARGRYCWELEQHVLSELYVSLLRIRAA